MEERVRVGAEGALVRAKRVVRAVGVRGVTWVGGSFFCWCWVALGWQVLCFVGMQAGRSACRVAAGCGPLLLACWPHHTRPHTIAQTAPHHDPAPCTHTQGGLHVSRAAVTHPQHGRAHGAAAAGGLGFCLVCCWLAAESAAGSHLTVPNRRLVGFPPWFVGVFSPLPSLLQPVWLVLWSVPATGPNPMLGAYRVAVNSVCGCAALR